MKANLLSILTLTLAVATLTMLPIPCSGSSVLIGDINEDGHVDIQDVVMAAGQYSLTPSDPAYNSTIVERADIAPPFNGIIDILDLVTITSYYTG